MDIKEATLLLQSQEPNQLEKLEKEVPNTPKDERARTTETSMNYQLDSKLYSSNPPSRKRLDTVVPRMIDTVDNTVRGTISSVHRKSSEKNNEMLAELIYLRNENNRLKKMFEKKGKPNVGGKSGFEVSWGAEHGQLGEGKQ